MSSMLASLLKNSLLLASVSGVAATSQQAPWYGAQPGGVVPQATAVGMPGDPLMSAIDSWKRLQQSDNYAFSDYASFLMAHPGWPGETGRRAAAETSSAPDTASPQSVLAFFERFPPLTASGRVRYAQALAASGRRSDADEQARAAWRMGVLRADDESRVMSNFPGAIRPEDHDARMDMLLWQGATSTALRQIGYVSPARRPVFEARLAYRGNAADAAMKGSAAEALGRSDAGYIADKASWLRNNSQSPAARAWLAQGRQITYRPSHVEKWYEVLLTNARGAAADGQYALAYDIARQVDDAYPADTDVSDKPLGERDDYTSLVWLAGTVALQNLNRPSEAAGMFARYAGGSKTPQTRSKGYYWAGRAAEKAGQSQAASDWFQRAAGFSDLYYGQLAAERLRQPLKRPAEINTANIAQSARQEFNNREIVRATQLLGRLGRSDDQGIFIRQIAQLAKTDTDHALAGELSRSIGRPDLGVMVGRSALQNGLSDYTAAGFPTIPVPESQSDYFTIIHAITRQESQFNRSAVSRAGARGLMQLMPGTARETAGKLGLGYNVGSLTTDTSYNIQLGSSYFQRMLSYYSGSYPLAVAAYNAGPGNVNKWIAANGDPRLPYVDTLDWVEKIPIFETKNYVQRVLENAVVYDLMHPDKARSRGPNNISWYLGKNTPG